eukprot:6490437-Amphidinium_carterae.1
MQGCCGLAFNDTLAMHSQTHQQRLVLVDLTDSGDVIKRRDPMAPFGVPGARRDKFVPRKGQWEKGLQMRLKTLVLETWRRLALTAVPLRLFSTHVDLLIACTIVWGSVCTTT